MSTSHVVIQPRPEYGKLYGITYDAVTKAEIIRVPRILKVGIGIAKGRAIQVFLFGNKWHIRHGVWDKSSGREKLIMKTVYQGGAVVNGVTTPNTKEAAEAWHNANKHLAAVSNRPQKVPYFTFSRRVITEEAGKTIENFEPDFDAIEAHGNTPRRIPVILTSDNPLQQQFQWWTASEMKCHGDGLLAERAVSAGVPGDSGWAEAKASGQKMFLYSPCWTAGCPHKDLDCKPHSTLNIQLAYALRLGATAYFTSTGQVSADRLSSSLKEIRGPIERRGYSIAGIEIDLVLDSFQAKRDGKPSVQPCVSLELRAKSAEALTRLLDESSWAPVKIENRQAQLVAAIEPETWDVVPEAVSAAAFADETEPDFDDAEPEPPSPAAVATQQKQEEAAKKLQRRRQEPEPVATAPSTAPVDEGSRPWSSQESMDAWFESGRERVGVDAFEALVRRHQVTPELRWDDPKAALLCLELRSMPDGPGGLF